MSENERKSMIRVRGGFSDKTGIAPCNTQMQIDEFDDRTRTLIGKVIAALQKAESYIVHLKEQHRQHLLETTNSQ